MGGGTGTVVGIIVPAGGAGGTYAGGGYELGRGIFALESVYPGGGGFVAE